MPSNATISVHLGYWIVGWGSFSTCAPLCTKMEFGDAQTEREWFQLGCRVLSVAYHYSFGVPVMQSKQGGLHELETAVSARILRFKDPLG